MKEFKEIDFSKSVGLAGDYFMKKRIPVSKRLIAILCDSILIYNQIMEAVTEKYNEEETERVIKKYSHYKYE